MSGADKYEADVFTPSGRLRDTVVLARDYDRDVNALRQEVERLSGECEGCPMSVAENMRIERDTLRAQVEAMRGLLLRFSDAYRNTCGSAYKLLPEVDAALQAKP